MNNINTSIKSSNQKAVNSLYIIYGIFILFLSVFRLLKEPYIDNLPELEKLSEFLYYLYGITCTYLYPKLINLLIAYGLITRKEWARYAVIAVMFTLPITLPLLHSVYGPVFSQKEILLQIGIMLSIVLLFWKLPVSQYRTATFRLKSFSSLLVFAILLLSIRPIYPGLYIKFKSGEPLLIPSARTIRIDSQKYEEEYKNQREINVSNISLRIPLGYQLHSTSTSDDSWSMLLTNINEGEEGLIGLGNDAGYFSELSNSIEFERLGITNSLALDRFIFSNNWNPGAQMLRVFAVQDGYEYREFTLNNLVGSLVKYDNKNDRHQEFRLYNNDGSFLIGGSARREAANDTDNLIKSLVSSIRTNSQMVDAAHYYQKGMSLFREGAFVDSQFEFSQAYSQNPENAEHAYMLIKSLLETKRDYYKTLERILSRSLETSPNHIKTKELQNKLIQLIKENESSNDNSIDADSH